METHPTTSIAQTLHTSNCTYGLLLGSGISHTSGIPTGWDITLQLVREFAELEHSENPDNPAIWYKEKFGEQPSYSELIEESFKSTEDRQQFLKKQIEPDPHKENPDEKTPTKAHYKIAELVESGYIGVIVTTNFDRLLEKALHSKGVEPTVVSTPQQVDGALPYVHEDSCYIVKLHGDYLDARLRNTSGELTEYPEEFEDLLDRLLDEFGWIISGWSAEWDLALREAFERCDSRRFQAYWTFVGELEQAAEDLVQHRDAVPVQIEGADEFFDELTEKIFALDRLNRAPVGEDVLLSLIKEYLQDRGSRIRLYDLLDEEANRVLEQTIYSDDYLWNSEVGI